MNFSEGITAALLSLIIILSSNKSTAQVATTAVAQQDLVSIKPSDIFLNADKMLTRWDVQPVPLPFYSEQEINLQKNINEKNSDAVVTFSPAHVEHEWTGIDQEDITPFTWKWVHLTLSNSDGTRSRISLRRPHWRLKEIGADSIQKKVYLNMPEMGVNGWATVTSVEANQLDTRVWDENRDGNYVTRPITGKFIHESDHVYQLYFDNSPKPLGVTATHPMWSADQKMWVSAADLKIGEHISTYFGESKLVKKEVKAGRHTVYNLEVYRDHNYFVTHQSLLVHNISWPEWSNLIRNAMIAPNRNITPLYSAKFAYQKIGDTFKMVHYYIERNAGVTAEKAAGYFSDAMEQSIVAGKNSGAKRIELLVYSVENPKLRDYYMNKLPKTFEGLNVEMGYEKGSKYPSFNITGELDKVKRIGR